MNPESSQQTTERAKGLFRLQPIEARLQRSIFSEPYQTQPRTRIMAACLVSFSVASLIAFISCASYTQTVTAFGQVTGTAGITRLKASQPGVVTAIHAKEGDRIASGAVIFETSADRPVDANHSFRKNVETEVDNRIRSIEDELIERRAVHNLATVELDRKIKWSRSDIDKQRNEVNELRSSLDVSSELLARAELAVSKKLLPKDQLGLRQLDLKDRKARFIATKRDLAKNEHELALLQVERGRAEHQRILDEAVLIQRQSTARQELSELISRTSETIVAPHDGVITSITASLGQSVDSTSALSLLAPVDDSTIIHIYVPGSAISHISEGDTVVIEHESMGSKSRGLDTATVKTVPRLPMNGIELSKATGGMPSDDRVSSNTLLFDVVAAPDNELQVKEATSQGVKRGTSVRAILPIKTQRIYEWLIDPLSTATGRQRAHGRE